MSQIEPYEVMAIRYAETDGRRPQHFLGGDPHDGPMPIDYFVWAIVGGSRCWVVDTGFGAADAAQRGRTLLRTAAEGLAAAGIEAARVEDVVITHLHYDHAGGLDQFPGARFHLQDAEMTYATGRNMVHPAINEAYTPDHVAQMIHAVYAGRVAFHEGEAELAPGLTLHRTGGHTFGLQVVRVWTRLGWLVLASDAAHFYEHVQASRPHPIVHNVADMMEGFRTLQRLADAPHLIIPGHDPRVMERYPPISPDLKGIAVRLDVEPAA